MRINDHPVAIIGAGPVGLSAAAHLLDRGIPFVVFEAGDQSGASLNQWGHVRMFSPWGYNIDKKAGELLRQAGQSGFINFVGNVEGNDIFKGTADIVICDGFVGNVALKASEGLAGMVGGFLKQEFSRNAFTKIAAIVAYPVLSAFKKRVDHRRYNGAALLGLRGLVFKSHGSADEVAFGQAMGRAYDAARNNLLDRVRNRIDCAAPFLLSPEASVNSGATPASI